MSTKVTRWVRYLGDTDQLEVQINGVAEIIAGASVVVKVVDTNDVTTIITGASVTDLVNRIVTVPLTNWLGAVGTATGRYRLFIVLDGITWPEDGAAEIDVRPNFTPPAP